MKNYNFVQYKTKPKCWKYGVSSKDRKIRILIFSTKYKKFIIKINKLATLQYINKHTNECSTEKKYKYSEK